MHPINDIEVFTHLHAKLLLELGDKSEYAGHDQNANVNEHHLRDDFSDWHCLLLSHENLM